MVACLNFLHAKFCPFVTSQLLTLSLKYTHLFISRRPIALCNFDTLFVTPTGPTLSLSVRCSYLPLYIAIAWNWLTPEILAQTNFYINWIVLFANWERCEEQQPWFKGLHAFVSWFDLFELVHHHLCHPGWMFISLNYACFSFFCISLPFAEMFYQDPLFSLFSVDDAIE